MAKGCAGAARVRRSRWPSTSNERSGELAWTDEARGRGRGRYFVEGICEGRHECGERVEEVDGHVPGVLGQGTEQTKRVRPQGLADHLGLQSGRVREEGEGAVPTGGEEERFDEVDEDGVARGELGARRQVGAPLGRVEGQAGQHLEQEGAQLTQWRGKGAR